MKHVALAAAILCIAACSPTPKTAPKSEAVTSTQQAGGSVTSFVDKTGGLTEEAQLLHIEATVTKLNQKTREMTVRTPDGKTSSFVVSDAVERLKEIKVGDKIMIDYAISIAYEIRKPTPEEALQPKITVEGVRKNAASSLPGATAAKVTKAVVTVIGTNPAEKTVTVKGPSGAVVSVRSINPDIFNQVKTGDTVVAEYSEAVVVNLKRN